MSTVHGQRAQYSAEEYQERRAARARWRAIQARMEARAWREALAMAEPDEPLLRFAAAYQHEMED